MMKAQLQKIALALALSACGIYVAHAAVRSQEKVAARESDSMTPERLARAKSLFGERCVRCHGADGRGETVTGGMLGVPNFTDEKWWRDEKTDARLVTSITEGREEMPAFAHKLTRREIALLVAYVRRFNKTADTPHE
jgi:mono/diheme cytochrome c family protein